MLVAAEGGGVWARGEEQSIGQSIIIKFITTLQMLFETQPSTCLLPEMNLRRVYL